MSYHKKVIEEIKFSDKLEEVVARKHLQQLQKNSDKEVIGKFTKKFQQEQINKDIGKNNNSKQF